MRIASVTSPSRGGFVCKEIDVSTGRCIRVQSVCYISVIADTLLALHVDTHPALRVPPFAHSKRYTRMRLCDAESMVRITTPAFTARPSCDPSASCDRGPMRVLPTTQMHMIAEVGERTIILQHHRHTNQWSGDATEVGGSTHWHSGRSRQES